MAETAIDRTKRALDLIPFVLDHPGISIQDLAREFSVSEKQIRADLDLLFVCGLPGYSPLELIDISTDDDYVDIIDPQLLDQPRNLTRREVIALAVALEALSASRNTNDSLQPIIASLTKKIQSSLSAPIRAPQIMKSEGDPQSVVPMIEEAMRTRSDLQIDYISAKSDSRNHRRISPHELFIENGEGYLQAWCFTAQAERTFRIDRIMTAERVGTEEQPVVSPNAQGGHAQKILLSLSGGGREFAERHAGISHIESTTPVETLVRVEIDDTNWLLRTLLGYGASIRILEPAALAGELKKLAQETLALYTR
jgi:proteasome accessory factor C